jgi:hypothetical protein
MLGVRAGGVMTAVIVVAGGVLVAPAAADPATAVHANAEPAARPTRRHVVYLEAFGKGGLWGLGYGYQLSPRFAVGAVASYSVIDGQHLMSFTPYLQAWPIGTRRHRWFVDVGPQVVHLRTPSPVPEWSGSSSTGVGAELSTGYEYHGRIVIRGFVMVVAGQGGAMPWVGADLGWSL